MVDQVLGGDVTDDIVKKMRTPVTHDLQRMSKPHHDFFKQEDCCCGSIILPSRPNLDPLGGVVSYQDDVFVPLGADQIDWANEISSPLLKRSYGNDRS